MGEIDDRILEFRDFSNAHPPLTVVRRFITFGGCYALSDERYYELKALIADNFGLHPIQVMVVGSAKLGFSISPNKRFQPFRDESDIDVAVVSDQLFDKFWEAAFDYANGPHIWNDKNRFVDYLFRGWIRPDKLPTRDFEIRDQWWDFFRSITSSGRFGDYKIVGGIYRNWNFLEAYQSRSVELCTRE